MAVYYFLEEDHLELKRLISKNLTEISKVQKEMAKAASQTSETWHDNFGFEDGVRSLDKLINYTNELSIIYEESEILDAHENEVIGKEIILDINGRQHKKIISSYINLKDEGEKISYACPIAQEYILNNYPNSKFKL